MSADDCCRLPTYTENLSKSQNCAVPFFIRGFSGPWGTAPEPSDVGRMETRWYTGAGHDGYPVGMWCTLGGMTLIAIPSKAKSPPVMGRRGARSCCTERRSNHGRKHASDRFRRQMAASAFQGDILGSR